MRDGDGVCIPPMIGRDKCLLQHLSLLEQGLDGGVAVNQEIRCTAAQSDGHSSHPRDRPALLGLGP
jgi:hypothetical protein